MPGPFSQPPTSMETASQRSRHASRHVRHARAVMTHVPWCMSESLTRGGGENIPGIPGACASRNCRYLERGPWCANCGQAHNLARADDRNKDSVTYSTSDTLGPFTVVYRSCLASQSSNSTHFSLDTSFSSKYWRNKKTPAADSLTHRFWTRLHTDFYWD